MDHQLKIYFQCFLAEEEGDEGGEADLKKEKILSTL